MKKGALLLLLLGLVLFVLPACSPAPAPPSTSTGALGQTFVLALGQSATVTGEGLTITFTDVTEDSRCPTGAT